MTLARLLFKSLAPLACLLAASLCCLAQAQTTTQPDALE
jgi:hypothetical protein